MGIYIPSVRLPDKGCFPEHFVIDSDGFVYKSHKEALFGENAVGKAIEIPPHGALIDVDKIHWTGGTWESDFDYVIKKQINMMPTIIEAEDER